MNGAGGITDGSEDPRAQVDVTKPVSLFLVLKPRAIGGTYNIEIWIWIIASRDIWSSRNQIISA